MYYFHLFLDPKDYRNNTLRFKTHLNKEIVLIHDKKKLKQYLKENIDLIPIRFHKIILNYLNKHIPFDMDIFFDFLKKNNPKVVQMLEKLFKLRPELMLATYPESYDFLLFKLVRETDPVYLRFFLTKEYAEDPNYTNLFNAVVRGLPKEDLILVPEVTSITLNRYLVENLPSNQMLRFTKLHGEVLEKVYAKIDMNLVTDQMVDSLFTQTTNELDAQYALIGLIQNEELPRKYYKKLILFLSNDSYYVPSDLLDKFVAKLSDDEVLYFIDNIKDKSDVIYGRESFLTRPIVIDYAIKNNIKPLFNMLAKYGDPKGLVKLAKFIPSNSSYYSQYLLERVPVESLKDLADPNDPAHREVLLRRLPIEELNSLLKQGVKKADLSLVVFQRLDLIKYPNHELIDKLIENASTMYGPTICSILGTLPHYLVNEVFSKSKLYLNPDMYSGYNSFVHNLSRENLLLYRKSLGHDLDLDEIIKERKKYNFDTIGDVSLPRLFDDFGVRIRGKINTKTKRLQTIDSIFNQHNIPRFLKIRDGWLSTSNGDEAACLKYLIDSTNIIHHDEEDAAKIFKRISESDPTLIEQLKKGIQISKTLTKAILDELYPTKSKIRLYRGTTTDEVVKEGTLLLAKSNCVSSWSTLKETAKKFAETHDGVIIQCDIDKSDILTSNVFFSYKGSEFEYVVISKGPRLVKVVWKYEGESNEKD